MDAVLQDQGERLRKCRSSHSRGEYLFQSRDRRGGNRERLESLSCRDRVRLAGQVALGRVATLLRGRAKSRSTLRLDPQYMPDLKTLQAKILGQITAAQDESYFEAVPLADLDKKGRLSALLAGLGKMAPDERMERGGGSNALKDEGTGELRARGGGLEE